MSEVFRSEMNRRCMKCHLNYCEDASLNLIDFTVILTDMNIIKKPAIIQGIIKLNDGVLQLDNDSDIECEFFESHDYDELSEDSETGEIVGFRNM